jgi:hypothetical protein
MQCHYESERNGVHSPRKNHRPSVSLAHSDQSCIDTYDGSIKYSVSVPLWSPFGHFVLISLHIPPTMCSATNVFVIDSSQDYRFLYAAPLFGYGFAWVGHFFFEKNRPATFKQPIYSLMGDFMMW